MNVSRPTHEVDLYVLGASVRSVRGVVCSRVGSQLELSLDAPVSVGDAVCLRIGGDGEPWTYGRVECGGTEASIVVDGERRVDRRDFYRVWGPLQVRYRPVSEGQLELVGLRWLRRGEVGRGEFTRAPLFVEFSGSGLLLEVADPARRLGEPVLVGIRVPGQEQEHRLTARVVRTDPDNRRLALRFLRATPGATLALVELATSLMDQVFDPA